MPALASEVNAVDSVCLDFGKVFNGIFHNILTEQLTQSADKNDFTKGFKWTSDLNQDLDILWSTSGPF